MVWKGIKPVPLQVASKLIIALDFEHLNSALTLIEQLDPTTTALKVGNEMFTRFGPEFIRQLSAKHFKVFLDLKFHDIPHTVERACKASADLGVWMLNVHASGGLAMMQAARQALESYGATRPLLIAVTVLTSMGTTDLPSIGVHTSLQEQVSELSHLTQLAGLDGVVCSAHEVSAIKARCGERFLTITPGIRLSGDQQDDQTRIVTPDLALQAGSDYLVIGRPITQAANPAKIVQDLLESIKHYV